jgi:hypothetical protein
MTWNKKSRRSNHRDREQHEEEEAGGAEPGGQIAQETATTQSEHPF